MTETKNEIHVEAARIQREIPSKLVFVGDGPDDLSDLEPPAFYTPPAMATSTCPDATARNAVMGVGEPS